MDIKIYGIKTCGTVRKTLKYFDEKNISYEFINFKKEPVNCDKIEQWINKVSIDTLFNNKGTKYRQLKLKELNLDNEGKKQWLCNENILIKRPVVEYNDKIIVGFNEEKYNEIFK